MQLPGSIKNKITKNENGEDLSHLEITEVVLVHYILLKTSINKIQESCIDLFLINHLANY